MLIELFKMNQEFCAAASRRPLKFLGKLCEKYSKDFLLAQDVYQTEFSKPEWEKRRAQKCENFINNILPSLLRNEYDQNILSNSPRATSKKLFLCNFNECYPSRRFSQRNALVRHLISFHFGDLPGGGLFLLKNPDSFDRFKCRSCDENFKKLYLYKTHVCMISINKSNSPAACFPLEKSSTVDMKESLSLSSSNKCILSSDQMYTEKPYATCTEDVNSKSAPNIDKGSKLKGKFNIQITDLKDSNKRVKAQFSFSQ